MSHGRYNLCPDVVFLATPPVDGAFAQYVVHPADFAYKHAGVDGIFPGSPFERRFRDMHTLSQQIQSRSAHFEAVGHILLGGEPPVFL